MLHGHFVHEEGEQWLGKRLADSKELVTLPIWLLRFFFAKIAFGWASIWTQIYPHLVCIWGGWFDLFSRPSCHQFSNHVISKFLTIQSSHQSLPICRSVPLIIFPSRHNLQPCILLEILSHGRIPLHAYPSGPPLSKANVYIEFPIGHTLNFTSWGLLGLYFDQ